MERKHHSTRKLMKRKHRSTHKRNIQSFFKLFKLNKPHKRIRKIAIALIGVITIGLLIHQYNMSKMVQAIEYQISLEELAVNEQKAKLEQLQAEYAEMDSPDYIKKVASNELGMVEKDTIVIKTR